MALRKARGGGKEATYDKLMSRDAGDTIAQRDVYETQQIERSEIESVKTTRPATITSTIVALVVMVLGWVVMSGVMMGFHGIQTFMDNANNGGGSSVGTYVEKSINYDKSGNQVDCYRQLNAKNMATGKCYGAKSEVPEPSWHKAAEKKAAQQKQTATDDGAVVDNSFGANLVRWSWIKFIVAAFAGAIAGVMLDAVLKRKLAAQNLMNDTADINQYKNDQHIAVPREVAEAYDVFPDVGAHSSVQPSSMISHVMLNNKGIKKVQVTQRATNTDDEYIKGEPLVDAKGLVVTKTMPMIDEAFGQDLFEKSGVLDKSIRKVFDPTTIKYNPDGRNREKLGAGEKGKYKTWADVINDDWIFPEYETQRPAGAYVVDTAPVNTMVLAITRAGKGQTYIEPMIDMWLRESRPNNMVINDPKGELLVKNYVRATVRGFQVVQFNLINNMKTDIYNPLGLAAEAAREGDFSKEALYVENIADVFFPTDGGEDPVWPNAANNAFKRAAYGLIDYYLEEEREQRNIAIRTNMDPSVLDTKLDNMWGKVTLYNCYQLFVQLTAKKKKAPVGELNDRAKAKEFDEPGGREVYDDLMEKAQAREFLWDDNPEVDLLTLFFNATAALPRNSSRTLIANADNALRSMGAAEKMLASVYGIAITAMSFFTDPTISTLTSGTPSQNVDLGGLAFPRRIGVRFAAGYVKKLHLVGTRARWSAYGDAGFTEELGKDFKHEDIVSREGWARYYFMGKFPQEKAYLKLEILDQRNDMLVETLYFQFKKGYQQTLDGRRIVADPITGEDIVKNGVLAEMVPAADGFERGHHKHSHVHLVDVASGKPTQKKGETNSIIQTSVRYSEQPKVVFLVTPPHLMKYAKLILILIKQLVDLNFDKSYMTKSDQKPLFKTRFMLDELANLQSEGHGISGFETMLSIGLGQEQQFTLILQTLQQLRDVYGESVDKIVQGNAQPLDAKIATPMGWTTMGEIAVGDEVLIPAGGSATVDGVFPQGVRPVYRVTTADGRWTEACDEHLWEVEIEE